MKKLFLLLGILTFTFTNVFGQGLQFATQEQLEEVEIWVNEERGFSSNLPSSFSLEKYCPPVLTQKGSSCVGWSVCYASMSIMYNYMLGITDPFQKYALAFDPYFMYASLKNSYDFDCEEGLLMQTAMNFLYEKGTKRWAMIPYLNCQSEWTKDWWNYVRSYSQPFALNTYYRLPTIDNSVLDDFKHCVSICQPIMIGVSIDETIRPLGSSGGTVGSDGLWTTKLTGDIIGGHAMTIIGYDDYKFGGAFKVMNSWGRSYGDNGYNWIKYNDIIKVVKEAYVLVPKLLKNDDLNKTILTDSYTRFTFEEGQWKGDTYEGTIKDGEMHGQGYYIWSKTGNIYVGGFNKGEYNGIGILFNYQKETLTDFEYDNGVLISREERGFGAEKESELDKYMGVFGSELKRVEADPDFEIPEMSDTKIKSEGFNFNKGGFNFNKTNNYE